MKIKFNFIDIFKILIGIILILIGLIGGFIPIFQGWIFGIPGLIILSKYFKIFEKILNWVKRKKTKKKP
tara:strand:+ start:277 stop:483 length:207 start_codon:yes stop_codon:yes gene_type:complete